MGANLLFQSLICLLCHILLSNQTGAHKMQTRYMERSNSIAREKRALDPSSAEEGQSDRKRPALARYFFVSTVFLFSFKLFFC